MNKRNYFLVLLGNLRISLKLGTIREDKFIEYLD